MNPEKEKLQKQAKERIVIEMSGDERFKTFFEQYRESSVKSFIKKYANHKSHQEVYGDYYTKLHERFLMNDWLKGAWSCLEQIQNKKLFDMACQWHAEEVAHMPDIDVSTDFIFVQKNILDYNFLPDITEEELAFYIQFLRNTQHVMDLFGFRSGFGTVNDIREQYREEAETGIAYFDYHNTYTGNQNYLILPDIRGEKESVYVELARAANREKYKDLPKKEEKAYLHADDEEIIKFALKFKDRKTANFIPEYNDWIGNNDDIIMSRALAYLDEIYPEIVPVATHANWQDAIYDAAMTHRQKKIGDLLPTVFQEYQMKRRSGIPITRPEELKSDYGLRSLYRDLVLHGRELKGEPRNFNF